MPPRQQLHNFTEREQPIPPSGWLETDVLVLLHSSTHLREMLYPVLLIKEQDYNTHNFTWSIRGQEFGRWLNRYTIGQFRDGVLRELNDGGGDD